MLLDRVRGDPQLLHVFAATARSSAERMTPPAESRRRFMTEMLSPDGKRGEQALRTPLLRHQRDPASDRILGRMADRPALELDRAPESAVGAEEGPGDLGLAGADQPVEADDLAPLDLEGDVLEQMVGRPSAVRTGSPLRLSRHVVLEDRAADHHLDQLRPSRDLGKRLGRDVLAVPQHGDGVAELEDLVELVGDVDHSHILIPAGAGSRRRGARPPARRAPRLARP